MDANNVAVARLRSIDDDDAAVTISVMGGRRTYDSYGSSVELFT